MPDLDRLPRGVRKGWSRVASAVQGAQPPDVVADAVEKALAKTLRVCGDLTWLQELNEVVDICQRADSVEPLNEFVKSLDPRISRGVESAFIDVAQQLAVSRDMQQLLSDTSVLAPGLLRMIDKLCLSPLGPDLVPRVFSNHAELQRYVDAVHELTNASGIAEQVTRRRFDVSKLRAPRTRLDRPGTADLLHAPIT